MASPRKSKSERPLAAVRTPNQDILPATIIDTNPFYIDMSQGTHRKALQPFTLTLQTLRPRSSAEILAEMAQIDHSPTKHVASRPATPTPYRHPHTPVTTSPVSSGRSSSRGSVTAAGADSPDKDVFQTPESHRTVTRVRQFAMKTSPATASSSGSSKRSIETDGDVRMKNGTLTSPELRHLQQQQQQQQRALRALVMEAVHDNFEFERARFAGAIQREVMAAITEEVEVLVRENFEAALARALELPFEEGGGVQAEEAAVVRVVRERLRGMSEEGLVRIFCNDEMLEVLRRVVRIVELEVSLQTWDLLS
ncbi:hypothetical protein CORC01_05388 [Colletotrichum orchidophilum]|uniref:Uncharacterized protein n=1 Tax=Colletotrichum orchidophilum TaxID=1209926 RepID=A0A1G4BDA4_9PEZI|nr:uncharacterized protein CORC01_05388 [Colletotrichum orchidophilum]OHE99347.1 hypothetical protein CORC01_05388 [Colletotrichum orchidophilum]